VLAALQAKLGVGTDGVFKAGSLLSGGIVGHGETCGALSGALMAVGCVVGREKLPDIDQFRRAKIPGEEMYQRFHEQLGHTVCAEIHKIRYGRTYRLTDPEDMKAFHRAGGHQRDGCPEVCAIAARTAADLILRLQDGSYRF
jgi:C_GCAxxG_C_C family probable redox protein